MNKPTDQYMNCENKNGVNIDSDFTGDAIEFDVSRKQPILSAYFLLL